MERLNAPMLNQTTYTLKFRGGTGMKIQILVGYWVSDEFQVQVSPERVYVTLSQMTLASQAKCSVDTKFQTCVNYNIKFSMATESYSKFSILWWASNREILSLRLACTTADLIPYRVGYWGANTGLDPNTRSTLNKIRQKNYIKLFYQVLFHSRCNNFLQDNCVTVVMLCKPDGGLPSMITPPLANIPPLTSAPVHRVVIMTVHN